MLQFFYGWRRKTGVVTLVMACALMGGWIRSLRDFEEVHIPVGATSVIFLLSADGYFAIGRTVATTPHYFSPTPEVVQLDREQLDSGMQDFHWCWRLAGIGVGFNMANPPQINECVLMIAPYVTFTPPLTFLAAYLLLCKPRKRESETAK
ncbi:MAG: hypothetical protein JWP89_3464 [Schlesneria sp.]|nr:hypothetical protein [Schlesneria sp.]